MFMLSFVTESSGGCIVGEENFVEASFGAQPFKTRTVIRLNFGEYGSAKTVLLFSEYSSASIEISSVPPETFRFCGACEE